MNSCYYSASIVQVYIRAAGAACCCCCDWPLPRPNQTLFKDEMRSVCVPAPVSVWPESEMRNESRVEPKGNGNGGEGEARLENESGSSRNG